MNDLSKDKIGRQPLVDKIKYLIENLPQDEHFCLALDGEWGSGKTFVMEMLRKSLKEHSEYIVIDYDAWKNNFYSDPLIAILYCLLDSIPKENLTKKNLRVVLRAVKQVSKNKANNGFDSVVDGLYNAGGWGTVCAFALEIIKLVIKQAKNSILDNTLFDDYKSYQSLLNESISILDSLTVQKTDDGKQRRLIIMVDEIDRCLPNEQLLVLERLHHLFNVKNCVVIVALNKKAVSQTFKIGYGGDGENYQRKFFDFTYDVKTLPEKFIYRLFMQDLMLRFQKLKNFNNAETESCLSIAYKVISDYLKKDSFYKKVDNRSISRLYNAILSIFNSFGWENLNYSSVFTVILCLFIERFIDSEVIQQSNRFDRDYIHTTLKLTAVMQGRAYDLYYHNTAGVYGCEQLDEFNKMMNLMAQIEDYTINSSDVFSETSSLKQLKKLLVIYGSKDETQQN